ncbi:adenylyltransferase/cytidyltransferase family protein [Jatrophihabitans sp. YIM 134969]
MPARPLTPAPVAPVTASVFHGRRALVLGTFDVLRSSQLDLLARANRESDRVTVGVLDRTASDPVAPRGEVVNTLTDRLLLAQHLRGVDEVIDVDDLDPVKLAADFDVVYLDDTVGVESHDSEFTDRLLVGDAPRENAPRRLRVVTDADAGERSGLVVGYIPGAWDALHAGHIAILDRARQMCDRLVVGVADDETLLAVKGRLPLVPHEERMAIVASLSMADEVVADRSSDKRLAWAEVHFDVLFKGTDWQDTPKGRKLEAEMAEVGARLEYLPYTWRISTTRIRKRLDALSA